MFPYQNGWNLKRNSKERVLRIKRAAVFPLGQQALFNPVSSPMCPPSFDLMRLLTVFSLGVFTNHKYPGQVLHLPNFIYL
jgi:hypothetical protein